MKIVCLIFSVLVCASAFSNIELEWEDFKVKFNKVYSVEEDARRHKIFLETKEMVTEHNKKFENGEVTFTMAINKFADMLPEEISYPRGYRQLPKDHPRVSQFKPKEGVSYPDSLDWREKGFVTPVKDQITCGCSWAFSVTGSLEGQMFNKTGKLVSLSEQNLVDCDHMSSGCDGGHVDNGFYYIIDNGGIDTEESYPYVGKQGECKYNNATIGGECSGLEMILSGKESDLQEAVVLVGPISCSVDARSPSFKSYHGGIYYEPFCTKFDNNHAVLTVGYGTLNGRDYWIVKNSWGTDWGEEGYIRMSRNRNNNCGIASQALYPTL